MTNKKRKGFTIVELVIVIAVIAILAGVLIPTFASIIDKANQSSDIQAVRQMNVLLKAESVDNPPVGIGNVIGIIKEAGYDTEEKLTPKSKGHSFYWYETENVIILVKDKVDETAAELIYPLDNEELTAAVNNGTDVNENNKFYNLKEYSGAGGNATPDGIPIVNLDQLITALRNENDGEYYLDPEDDDGNQLDEITLSDFVEVVASVTIDLNGKELLIEGNPNDWSLGVISVKGNLSFEDSSGNKAGNIILDACTGTDGWPCADYGIYVEEGEEGEEGGHLILDGVNIIGNMGWSIGNYGKTEIQKSKFIVKYGYGIENADITTITGGQFIAAGDYVCSVNNSSGTMTIEGTTFNEEGDEVSYMSNGPIVASGGELNLNKVNVTTGDTSDINVYCSGGANVNITGGLFNGKFNTTGVSYIYISGDTKHNDKDFKNYSTSDFKANCCSSYVPEVGTLIRVIKCTYKDDNDKSVTTFILHNDFYALDGLAGIKAFEGTNGLIIPAGSVVVFDNSLIKYTGSNRPETELTQNIDIDGTLEINGGNFYAGTEDQKENNIKNTITVFNKGTLVLNAINYGEHYRSNSLSLAQFLALGVVKDGQGNPITDTSTVAPNS